MKNKLLLVMLILLIPSPASALSKRSIITYSNNAQKCEKKYIDYGVSDFSRIQRWWDDVERVTNRHNRDRVYIKSFVEFSKTYCKALKIYSEALEEGASSYVIEMMMIELIHDLDSLRIENDIYL